MRAEEERFLAQQFERYSGAVYRRALRILSNPHDAEEALQDVFVKLALAVHKLDLDQPVLHWLFRVTTNHCLDIVRKKQLRSKLLAINYHPEFEHSWVPENALVLQEVLEQVSPKDAQAAFHAYCDGMAHHEIANVLGVGRRTVSDMLARVAKCGEKYQARSNRVRTVS